jgi:hypothetical protein
MSARVLVAAMASAVLLTACGSNEPKATPSSSPSPTTFTFSGTVTVEAGSGSEATDGGDCVTDGGYSDISSGAQVTVTDEGGKIVALGNLDPGHTAEVVGTFASTCVFGFTVRSVPEGVAFYSIEIAHRGALRYTRSDLATPLALSLGSK